jgi:hypothetical protein
VIGAWCHLVAVFGISVCYTAIYCARGNAGIVRKVSKVMAPGGGGGSFERMGTN